MASESIETMVPVEYESAKAEPEQKVYPKTISAEDRLRAELLTTKLQNVQLQLQIMQSDVQKAMQSRNTLVGDMGKLRAEYLDKYGVDLARVQINDDGSFSEIPAGGQAPR